MSGQRWFRTAEGGLVPDGDPAGEFLAYGVADEMSEDDAALVATPEVAPAAKKAARPADKSGPKGEDK